MTQGKISVANKAANGEGAKPGAPPTYEEATKGSNGGYPGDAEILTEFSWEDKNIRRIFIRKVYAILMIQLFVTVAIVALFTFCDPVRFYVQTHPSLYWASHIVFFGTYLTLVCCAAPRRLFPWNLILLAIFTVSMASMMAFVSSFYNTKSVVLCIGITAMVCLCVTVFSFQTKVDVTSCHGVLFVMCMATFFCAIVMAIVVPFGYVPWLHAIYGVVGAMFFTLFLAFDTQLLMGNKQYAMSPEEYIFATLSIYLDIIYLFSFLLQIFGTGRE